MPSSDSSNIHTILQIASKIKPKKILDIGPGCGKYGLMFREYLDGHRQGSAFHVKSSWKLIIDACEIFHAYITPAHEYIYNNVFKCDVKELWRYGTIRNYDLIFLGDVLEHFGKDEAFRVLDMLNRTFLNNGGHILISTPNFESQWNKPLPFNNEYEKHRCRFTPRDFKSIPNFALESCKAERLLTVLLRSTL